MDNSVTKKIKNRNNRTQRIRKHLRGTSEKPRLCVTKSNKNISVQLIDDSKHITIASASTLAKGNKLPKSKETAALIGSKIAELAKQNKIERVVFDRGHNKYHGLLQIVADAAREGGLKL